MPARSVVAREVQVISFQDVIAHFGQRALQLQLQESESTDSKALRAIEDKNSQERREAVRQWLQTYGVFQGIDGPKRPAIAGAVLEYADSRDIQRDLTTTQALVTAHQELMDICARANGKERNFTSLASKALWLCYPHSVPIFDSFAQRALWAISKLETDIKVLLDGEPEYRKFVHVWKALYKRYEDPLNHLDIGTYPYRVRIFDKILWLIGQPRYGLL